MKRFGPIAVVVVASLLFLGGCATEMTVAQKADAIKTVTSTAVTLGLVAIPDKEEAALIAQETKDLLDQTVLKALRDNDEQAIVALAERFSELPFLDKPKLAKVKLIIQTIVLPALDQYLPEDLIDKATGKLSEGSKEYMTAFFEGIRQGIVSYAGEGRSTSKGDLLRAKLSE